MQFTQKKQPVDFNFDDWLELSKNDPESFEAMRLQSINQFIDSVPEGKQQRLRCLQWKIDRVRDKMPTPLAACVAISDMMWDSLDKLNQLYHDCENISTEKPGTRRYTPVMKSADILQFQPRS